MNKIHADKRTLYKTAKAIIGCAHFKAGDFVAVKAWHRNADGTFWFIVNGAVAYPEHHLTEFVL